MAAFRAGELSAGGDHGDRGRRGRAERGRDGDRGRRAVRPRPAAPAARARGPRRRTGFCSSGRAASRGRRRAAWRRVADQRRLRAGRGRPRAPRRGQHARPAQAAPRPPPRPLSRAGLAGSSPEARPTSTRSAPALDRGALDGASDARRWRRGVEWLTPAEARCDAMRIVAGEAPARAAAGAGRAARRGPPPTASARRSSRCSGACRGGSRARRLRGLRARWASRRSRAGPRAATFVERAPRAACAAPRQRGVRSASTIARACVARDGAPPLAAERAARRDPYGLFLLDPPYSVLAAASRVFSAVSGLLVAARDPSSSSTPPRAAPAAAGSSWTATPRTATPRLTCCTRRWPERDRGLPGHLRPVTFGHLDIIERAARAVRPGRRRGGRGRPRHKQTCSRSRSASRSWSESLRGRGTVTVEASRRSWSSSPATRRQRDREGAARGLGLRLGVPDGPPEQATRPRRSRPST